MLRQFIGQGLGGHLLTIGTEQAWNLGARRAWVHTCSLDDPHALKNYQLRGFTLYNTEVSKIEIPEHPTGPWVGARISLSDDMER